MFGINRKHLVANLTKMAVQRCGYLGSLCDCKYQPEATIENVNERHSEATGCPELNLAARLLAQMTDQEFIALAVKAGVKIENDHSEVINVNELADNFRSKLLSSFAAGNAELVKKVKKNQKSAYDLGNSKNAMHKMMPRLKKTKVQ